MTSKREQVLEALATLLEAAFTDNFERDPEKAPDESAAGTVIMRDGDPGEPDITLSPIQYQWNHEVAVEVAAVGEDRTATVDALLVTLDTAIAANRTLGGLAIDTRVMSAPVTDETSLDGTQAVRYSPVKVNVFYVSNSPIG